MRGTLINKQTGEIEDGIIPADAGNTSARPSPWAAPWDHPRGCGEHCDPRLPIGYVTGSSPRMRGTPGEELDDRAVVRIIPADAGNTIAP